MRLIWFLVGAASFPVALLVLGIVAGEWAAYRVRRGYARLLGAEIGERVRWGEPLWLWSRRSDRCLAAMSTEARRRAIKRAIHAARRVNAAVNEADFR